MTTNYLTKKHVTVQLNGDWTLYTDAIPKGSRALGVVTVGDITGALVLIEATKEYVMIQPRCIYRLNDRKVKAAIHQAQTTPAEPES